MCTLVTQIYTVVLLVSSTVAISSTADWTADTQHKRQSYGPNDGSVTKITFSDDWDVIKTDPPRKTVDDLGWRATDKRQIALARLDLDERQEAKVSSWQLTPDMDNDSVWWKEYRALRDDFAAVRGQNSDTCSPPSSNDIALQAIRPSARSPNHSNTPAT